MNTAQNDIILRTGKDLGRELESCLEVIKEGGAVDPKAVTDELPQAIFVALKHAGGRVVGVGAIKRLRPLYAKGIAQKCGFEFDENLHELGYVSVRKTHRNQGIARALLLNLLDVCKTRPLFATTSNEAMKKLLSELGFQQHGKEWRGNNSMLSLWIGG
ncbi:MAG: GNAT family N-acetyltransferase [Verrucomicrobia bacterium]|nr:GNAT family N-acetyltransferase [Verrucomicrobiota bacterium]